VVGFKGPANFAGPLFCAPVPETRHQVLQHGSDMARKANQKDAGRNGQRLTERYSERCPRFVESYVIERAPRAASSMVAYRDLLALLQRE